MKCNECGLIMQKWAGLKCIRCGAKIHPSSDMLDLLVGRIACPGCLHLFDEYTCYRVGDEVWCERCKGYRTLQDAADLAANAHADGSAASADTVEALVR